MPRKMPLDDFRAIRHVLKPKDYAVRNGKRERSPSDLIPKKTWRHLTILPDEAAIRTSNRHGTVLDMLNELAGAWPLSIADAEHPDMIDSAMIELINAG